MSKRAGKAQASSARAASTYGSSAFGAAATFGVSTSPLSYVSEPPDLSAISDPNVVVYFRNLSKKDSTTKAKALEDLQAHIAALQQPVEEGLLEAWVRVAKIYRGEARSNKMPTDQNIPTHLHRQCKGRSPECPSRAGPCGPVSRQAHRKAHA